MESRAALPRRWLGWLLILSCARLSAAQPIELRGAWQAESYVLKDGTRHLVRGQILFTEREWSVVFVVTSDGRTPQRGSGEAGTYRLDGNQLVFSHRYNLSGGSALPGLPASPLELNLHDEKQAPGEACTVELEGRRLTIHFPSGNAMQFARAAEASPAPAKPVAPPIDAQVTFLYFDDVERAARFYGETLGLAKTFDLGWVKIFSLSPTSSVGLVDGVHGSLRPSKDKPVMLSLVVDDVDGFHRFLVARGVDIPEPPADAQSVPVRAFSFRDPEGHHLEVFRWLTR